MQTGGSSWDRGGRFDHSSPEAIARIYLDVVEGVRPDLVARIMSHDVAAQEQLILGFEMGLGEPKEEAIELLGESLEALGMPWRAARLRH